MENMGRPRSFSKEFRDEAVRLTRSADRSVGQIATELGIARRTLTRWAHEIDVEAGRVQGLTFDERSELVRLRRRVTVLEEERAILLKAAAFFARETDGTR
jgi:transposase